MDIADRERLRREANNHVFARGGQARAANAGRRVHRDRRGPLIPIPPVVIEPEPIIQHEILPELPANVANTYRTVTIHVRSVPASAQKAAELRSAEILSRRFEWFVLICFVVFGLVDPVLSIFIYFLRFAYQRGRCAYTKWKHPTKYEEREVDAFSILKPAVYNTRSGDIILLSELAYDASINEHMVNILHRDGRMCDYSKGDVWARCVSVISMAHQKKKFTNAEGEELSEEELTSESSNVIKYFLQSILITRSHYQDGCITQDAFASLLSN